MALALANSQKLANGNFLAQSFCKRDQSEGRVLQKSKSQKLQNMNPDLERAENTLLLFSIYFSLLPLHLNFYIVTLQALSCRQTPFHTLPWYHMTFVCICTLIEAGERKGVDKRQ